MLVTDVRMERRGGAGGGNTASLPDLDARQLPGRNPEKDEKYVSGSRSGKSPPDRSEQSVRKVEGEGRHCKPADSLTSACQENVFYLNRSRQEQKYSAGLDCAVRDMTTPTEEDWEEWTTSEGSGSTISVLHSEIVKESKEDFQPSRSFDYLDSKVEKTNPEEQVLVAEVQSDFKAFPSDEPFSMSTRSTSISIYETERMSSNQRRSIADTSTKTEIKQKESSITRPKEFSREHRHLPAQPQPETEFNFSSSLRKERSPSRYPAIDTYLGLTAAGEEEDGAGDQRAGHYNKWERELRREEEMARCRLLCLLPQKVY